MLRLHLPDPIARTFGLNHPTGENAGKLPGDGAAVVLGTATTCVVFGVLTIAIALLERAGVSTGPVLAIVALGVVVGLLAWGAFEQRWHNREVLTARVYKSALLLVLAGIACAVLAMILTIPMFTK